MMSKGLGRLHRIGGCISAIANSGHRGMGRRYSSTGSQLLTESQRRSKAEIVALLTDTKLLVSEMGFGPEAVSRVDGTLSSLESLFSVVFVGEYNVGKTSLINALLRQPGLLEEGPIPTTAAIFEISCDSEGGIEKGCIRVDEPTKCLSSIRVPPREWLSEIQIVDTPGVNTVNPEHTRITSDYMTKCDLVLFITSVERPMSESEVKFLTSIQSLGRKVIMAVNKSDLLTTPQDLEKVTSYVRDESKKCFQFPPKVVTVSSKELAKAEVGSTAFEKEVRGHLEPQEMIATKLGNPLGVASKIYEEVGQELDAIERRLKPDKDFLEHLGQSAESSLSQADDQLQDKLAKIDALIEGVRKRGNDSIDTLFSLKEVPAMIKNHLVGKASVIEWFRQRVALPEDDSGVTAHSERIAEWLSERHNSIRLGLLTRLKLHLDTTGSRDSLQVEKRLGEDHQRTLTGETHNLPSTIDLRKRIAAATSQAISHNSPKEQAEDLRTHLDQTVSNLGSAGAASAGASGIGWAAGLLDPTFLIPTALLATTLTSAALLPWKKNQAKAEFKLKVDQLAEKLKGSMELEFGREKDRADGLITNDISGFKASVESQEKKLAKWKDAHRQLGARESILRNQIASPRDIANAVQS